MLGFLSTASILSWISHSNHRATEASLSFPEEVEAEAVSLVYDGHRAMDHYLYFHNREGGLDYAKKADVLLLGNSRVLCGLDASRLEAYRQRTGTSFYNLGFGYDEGGAFPLELIKRYDLRPKLVVVNADASFWEEASPLAREVMQSRPWKVGVEFAEFTGAWHLRRSIHRWLPKLIAPEKIAIWRCHRDGSWIVRTSENQHLAVSYVEVASLTGESAAMLAAARDWKRELDQLGIGLAITLVPSPDSDSSLAEAIGTDLGVATILAPIDSQFETFDGDHLDAESAQRFTSIFLDQFEDLGLEEAL